jgi:hypothetical protein
MFHNLAPLKELYLETNIALIINLFNKDDEYLVDNWQRGYWRNFNLSEHLQE